MVTLKLFHPSLFSNHVYTACQPVKDTGKINAINYKMMLHTFLCSHYKMESFALPCHLFPRKVQAL